MALKSNYNAARMSYEVQEQANRLYKKMINSFIRAGEDFITNARGQMQSHAMGQYMDQTTNLRNSIGYFVFQNGKLIHDNNNNIANRGIIEEFIKPDGIQLIGLAGMNYASHVESKGYNVISYQADICIVDLSTYLERLELIEKGTGARMEESFLP
jgi:hypothetical protein